MNEATWKFTGAKTKQLMVDGVPESNKHRSHMECLEDYSRARRKRLKPLWADARKQTKKEKAL